MKNSKEKKLFFLESQFTIVVLICWLKLSL
ncbi:hypothetical protein SAMN06265375_1095 [Muriicola jejuensis]|nr:hypothetical protein SAMN06265375_1095 [Muriicola jejuensis]